MSNIRLILGHPLQSASEVNVPMFEAAKKLPHVNAIDLYGAYPKHNINSKAEQRALLENDILVIQCPIFWYNIPSMISVWFAMVLQYGFAYGREGDKLQGKKMMLALTAGAPLETYSSGGQNNYTLRELLRNVEQTANMIGMEFLPPFVLSASRTAKEEGRVNAHVQAYTRLLKALIDNTMKFEQLNRFEIITSSDVNNLIQE